MDIKTLQKVGMCGIVSWLFKALFLTKKSRLFGGGGVALSVVIDSVNGSVVMNAFLQNNCLSPPHFFECP